MSFPLNAYLAAFAGAFLTTLVTMPLWRKWCLRTGLVDDPGHRKIHQTPTPLAGGLAVLTGLLIPLIAATLLLMFTSDRIEGAALLAHGFHRRALQLSAILAGAVAIVVVGWLDDKHELSPLPKFVGQALIAGLVASAEVRVTLFVPSLVFSYAITVLWILTVINAFNFMDNMNGLCAGLGAVGAGLFAAIAALNGQYLVASAGFLMFGSLIGFLPYNFPNARAFLGDAGSHLVGYLLAVLAILPHFYTRTQPRTWAVVSPLLILAIPLADLVRVVWLRWRMGKPFYVGDTNHLSHWLVRNGLSRTQAVLLIWLAAIIVGAAALL